MNIKSIEDIIDYDFVRLCYNDLTFEYFDGEIGAFLVCDEIKVDTFLFLQKAVPLECVLKESLWFKK